ncbi:hypothetical protein ACVOZ6_004718 [Escherichia coli]
MLTCARCGKQGNAAMIRGFHNDRCKNFAVVGRNLITNEWVYYRWLHIAAKEMGIKETHIREVIVKRRNSTAGYAFRLATQEEIDAGKALATTDYVRRTRRRGVYRIDSEGNEVYFDMLTKAARATPNATPDKIAFAAKGIRKTHAGYRWRYA